MPPVQLSFLQTSVTTWLEHCNHVAAQCANQGDVTKRPSPLLTFLRSRGGRALLGGFGLGELLLVRCTSHEAQDQDVDERD